MFLKLCIFFKVTWSSYIWGKQNYPITQIHLQYLWLCKVLQRENQVCVQLFVLHVCVMLKIKLVIWSFMKQVILEWKFEPLIWLQFGSNYIDPIAKIFVACYIRSADKHSIKTYFSPNQGMMSFLFCYITGQYLTKIGSSLVFVYFTFSISYEQDLMPIKWMSIEAIRDRIFSVQSDVWAYGVTLWELFTLGSTPYPGVEVNKDFLTFLEDGNRMDRPKYANQEMWVIQIPELKR